MQSRPIRARGLKPKPKIYKIMGKSSRAPYGRVD